MFTEYRAADRPYESAENDDFFCDYCFFFFSFSLTNVLYGRSVFGRRKSPWRRNGILRIRSRIIRNWGSNAETEWRTVFILIFFFFYYSNVQIRGITCVASLSGFRSDEFARPRSDNLRFQLSFGPRSLNFDTIANRPATRDRRSGERVAETSSWTRAREELVRIVTWNLGTSFISFSTSSAPIFALRNNIENHVRS